MNVVVFGTGYVGLVVGTCLSDLGNDVVCIDIDEEKIKKLNKGEVPFFEHSLSEYMRRNIKQGRLHFSLNYKEALKFADIIFIAVGTPSKQNGDVDLTYVDNVAKTIGQNLDHYAVIVNKSTVPVGTALRVTKIIKEHNKNKIHFDVVSNPEFLREGSAVRDFMQPNRIVIGVDSTKAEGIMQKLYQGLVRTRQPIIITDVKSAELIKYAANAMLATRISFMNEFARFCEKEGGDIKAIAKGIGLDERIGPRFLQAGAGYGGSCFPKDVKGLINMGKKRESSFKIIEAVDKVNEEQKMILFEKIQKTLGDLKGKSIALWGLAFKPKTDDVRESPALFLIDRLQKAGSKVKAFDPEAIENTKKIFPEVEYYDNPYSAVKDADAVVLVTEWNNFRDLDRRKIKSLLKNPILIDARNMYDPSNLKKEGFVYVCIGRNTE